MTLEEKAEVRAMVEGILARLAGAYTEEERAEFREELEDVGRIAEQEEGYVGSDEM